MLIIKNARILTMSERGEIEKGYIVIDNGIITDLGEMEELKATYNNIEEIDADGAIVTPGLVDAHSHIGIWEDGLNFEGADGNEETDPITPHLRAIDAVNPMDRAFEEALGAGVTTVVTGPGSANPIGGQIIAMKTCGRCVDKMTIAAPVGIKVAFGENPKVVYNDKSQTPTTRMAIAAQIREALYKACEYLEQTERYHSGEQDDLPDYDIKCEALIPLLKKEIPMHAHVHRADDIFTAIRIAKEFKLRLVLVHATEGHIIAKELKEEGYPVLSGPILTDRSKPELKNMNEANPAILTAEGVETALITDHPETPEKNFLLCAGMAMRNGMSRQNSLKAMTSVPAHICGVDNRVGKIEKGLDADIVIWNGNPPDITATARVVILGGDVVVGNLQN